MKTHNYIKLITSILPTLLRQKLPILLICVKEWMIQLNSLIVISLLNSNKSCSLSLTYSKNIHKNNKTIGFAFIIIFRSYISDARHDLYSDLENMTLFCDLRHGTLWSCRLCGRQSCSL